MKIIVEARNVYGVLKLYPVSPDAIMLAAIAGSKTIAPRVIGLASLISCGCQVEVIGGYAPAAREEINLNIAAVQALSAVEKAKLARAA